MSSPAGVRGLVEPFAYGRGWEELVRGTQPAAGANFTYKLEGQYESRLLACAFRLVTDANVANRIVTLDYLDADSVAYARQGAAVVITAGTTQDFSGIFTRGVGEWATAGPILFPIAPLFLEGGTSLRITVTNVQATDQLSNIRLVLERFPSGGRGGYPEGEVYRRRR